MKRLKKCMNLVPLMLFWCMMSVFVWSWIFTFLTDAPRENKIVLFIDASVPGEKEIAVYLEEGKEPDIEMVKVKPFTYSMMSSSEIRSSDLYIVKESNVSEYCEWFMPLPDNMDFGYEEYLIDGAAYGIRVFDAKTQEGAGRQWIEYEDENYYLFFGNRTLHMEKEDMKAVRYAKKFLELE